MDEEGERGKTERDRGRRREGEREGRRTRRVEWAEGEREKEI